MGLWSCRNYRVFDNLTHILQELSSMEDFKIVIRKANHNTNREVMQSQVHAIDIPIGAVGT